MSAHLGLVHPSGIIHFKADTAKACREFLNSYGLSCSLTKGWLSDKYMGAIDFKDKQWHAIIKPLGDSQ